MPDVTVAIPVRDGGELLSRVLQALARQTVEHELLVCDSGSRDDSVQFARSHGARVIEIAPSQFGHGTTRNLLMGEARGRRVALLTQDAEPQREDWLERLLEGFSLAQDVALVYGPYVPRHDASVPVRLEVERWFASLSPDGQPRVERLTAEERSLPADECDLPARDGRLSAERHGLPTAQLLGRRGFFTDANACIDRSAWEKVPFRPIPYAEDRALALDMLRAGYAKAFVPRAAVLHSHEYAAGEQLRRSFDEWRALREVYGWREPASPLRIARTLRGELSATGRDLDAAGLSASRQRMLLLDVALHSAARLTGAILGSRAEKLPAPVRQALSLERRADLS